MTHADAFLADILADPDDDVPRLIYADWLEEYGGPAGRDRAEFIRVQCTLAAGRGSRGHVRERQLLERYGREWAGPVARLASGWAFQRGFVAEVRIQTRTFLGHAEKLFGAAPVQSVRLSGVRVPLLVECSFLNRLHALNLTGNQLGSAGAQSLGVCEHFNRLTQLDLSDNAIGDRGVRALAAAPWLGRLTHLDLSNNGIGPAGMRALAAALEERAASPDGLALRTLFLAGNDLRAAGIGVIWGSPVLSRVARTC